MDTALFSQVGSFVKLLLPQAFFKGIKNADFAIFHTLYMLNEYNARRKERLEGW